MNLELALRRACVAHPYLGGIRTYLVIKRQRRDGGNDARTLGQVDVGVDPTGIHDIEGERPRFTPMRQQQQADSVAALFEIMAVAAQYRPGIEALLPGARHLIGTDESGGADEGARRQRQGRRIARRLYGGLCAVDGVTNVGEG